MKNWRRRRSRILATLFIKLCFLLTFYKLKICKTSIFYLLIIYFLLSYSFFKKKNLNFLNESLFIYYYFLMVTFIYVEMLEKRDQIEYGWSKNIGLDNFLLIVLLIKRFFRGTHGWDRLYDLHAYISLYIKKYNLKWTKSSFIYNKLHC